MYIGKFDSLKLKGCSYIIKIINKNYVYSLGDKFPSNNKIPQNTVLILMLFID